MTDLSDFEDCYSQDIKLDNSSNSQGFDVHAGQTWIYPTNYPVREYQFNIIEKALFENTLVSLPTGLGKTFIAAVVMYNFYRWYPNGKIVFIAPTRPLVKQQVDACYNIMAIPQEVTIELTGTRQKKSRIEIWNTKRVFFVTPQILQNDLQTVDNLGSKIRCIVFDEAHKARGNHAYCEVIRKLMVQNNIFRVLALSATPGSNVSDMKGVIQNLLISHLEFRTEESPDVSPYVFQRSIKTVVVPLDSKLQQVKNNYMEVLERYTRCLINYKVIQGNCCTLTKGRIFMTLKNFQEKNRGGGHPNYSEIMKNLNICVTLYHAYELLIRHGLRSFLSFFEDHIDKPLLRGNMNIIQIMEDVRSYLGTLVIAEPLPDGTYTEVPDGIKFGHPKYYKLEEILISHFRENQESRIIVFFEYRESVKEAYTLLMKSNPLVTPRIFLGQGSGVTQRVQLQVIQAFRDGKCNTLLSTCIGEEGLDVGEVDLIICFDISNKSPIRMIQRMGRTGRKREGSVIILVTKGREQQTLEECLANKKYLSKNLSALPDLTQSLYRKNPRMVPDDVFPACEKIYITVKKNTVKKNMNLKDMFTRKKSKQSDCPDQGSSNFKLLVNRVPRTQYDSQQEYTKNLKQGDIRSIFKKAQDANKPETSQGSSFEASSQLNLISDKSSECALSDEVFNEISTYLAIMDLSDDPCKVCNNLFPCFDLPPVSEKVNLRDWVQPNLSTVALITKESLRRYQNKHAAIENAIKPLNKNVDETFNSQIKMEISNFIAGMNDTSFNSFEVKDNQFSVSNTPIKQRINSKTPKLKRAERDTGKRSTQLLEDKGIDTDELLNFFKLKSLAELFENVKNSKNTPNDINDDSSDSILILSSPDSPILCTFQKSKATKSIISNRKNHNGISDSRDDSNSNVQDKSSSNKINDFTDIEDIFDLKTFDADFGGKVATQQDISKEMQNRFPSKPKHEDVPSETLDSEDICDLSIFGLPSISSKRPSDRSEILEENTSKKKKLNDGTEERVEFLNSIAENKSKKLCLRKPKALINEIKDRPYMPESINIEGKHCNQQNEQSQMTVTQILSFIGKNTTPANSKSKQRDYFQDMLDKM